MAKKIQNGNIDWLDPESIRGMYKVTITPKLASAWFERNLGTAVGDGLKNRPLLPQRVGNLAAAIRRGEWKVNGDPIRFDKFGRLIDGQHRLAAIMDSGKSVESWVVFGLDTEVFDTIDRGMARTPAHMLASRGEVNVTSLASAANLVYQHEQGLLGSNSGRTRPTVIQLEGVIDRHPALRESVAQFVTYSSGSFRLLTPAIFSGLHYLFGKKDAKLRDQFLGNLVSGAAIHAGSPLHQLRERLIKSRATNITRDKLSPTQKLGLTIKAWNLTRQGKTVDRLVFDPKNEEMQAIE